MYPSSSSSTSHGSMGLSGLTRYGSAPGSLLATTVDSVINGRTTELSVPSIHMGLAGTSRFFPSETSSQSSEAKGPNSNGGGDHHRKGGTGVDGGLQRSYRLNEFATVFSDLRCRTGGAPSSSSPTALVRHSSTPAGFLNALTPASDNAFSMARGIGSYKSKRGGENGGNSISRLSSQLSFTRDSLSHISEENESIDVNDIVSNASRNAAAYGHATPANTTFSINGSWDDTNSIIFSSPHSKRPKLDGLNIVESELHFGLSQSALEAATIEKLIEIPHDSVPCKIRAKRGCATHPRSIAERERRTRISGKLKKLQDLVPNMDKQTSYADMLDLAVQHIKGLQSQVQKLNKELQNCSCGCKQNSS